MKMSQQYIIAMFQLYKTSAELFLICPEKDSKCVLENYVNAHEFITEHDLWELYYEWRKKQHD